MGFMESAIFNLTGYGILGVALCSPETFQRFEERYRHYLQGQLFLKFAYRRGGLESNCGPLSTSASDWPIVPTPGDYDDGEFGGMKIGRVTEVLGENLPQRHFVHNKSHLTRTGLEPGPPQWEVSD
jgi:hypothetical protein